MKMKIFLCLAALVGSPVIASAANVVSSTVDDAATTNQNALRIMTTKPTLNMTEIKQKINRVPTLQELEGEEEERFKRSKERGEEARKKLASIQPDPSTLERLTKEELDSFLEDEEQDHPWIRRAAWRNRGDYSPYSLNMADPSKTYDRWAQGYRTLGGFIDCDHKKQNKNDNHNNNNNNNNQNQQGNGCSRWMMWAAVSIACA